MLKKTLLILFFPAYLSANDDMQEMFIKQQKIYDQTVKKIEHNSSSHFYYENFHKSTGTIGDPVLTTRRPAKTRSVFINAPMEYSGLKFNLSMELQSLGYKLSRFSSGETEKLELNDEELMLITKYTELTIPKKNQSQINISKANARDAGERLKDESKKQLNASKEPWNNRLEYNVSLSLDGSMVHKGLPVVYFSWYTDYCPGPSVLVQKVMMVNNQNVKFSGLCQSYSEGKHIYIQAVTPEGREYVIEQFKKKNWVTVSNIDAGRLYEIKFWAKGFTDAYKELGVDAI